MTDRWIEKNVPTEQLELGAAPYEPRTDSSVRGERWKELDEKIIAALRSDLLNERDKEVLRVLAGHKGAMNAIRSVELAFHAGVGRGEKGRRAVALAIETFVQLFGIPIGGLRVPPYGYFLIVDHADLALAVGPLWGEVYAHLRRLRALTGKQTVARLFGQAMLKLAAEVQDPGRAGKPKEAA
jgi:hypothetical protein